MFHSSKSDRISFHNSSIVVHYLTISFKQHKNIYLSIPLNVKHYPTSRFRLRYISSDFTRKSIKYFDRNLLFLLRNETRRVNILRGKNNRRDFQITSTNFPLIRLLSKNFYPFSRVRSTVKIIRNRSDLAIRNSV